MADTLNVYQRLLAAQKEIKAPREVSGRFGKARSAEQILEAVKPICQKYDLLLKTTDRTQEIGGRNYITTTAMVRNVDKPEEVESAEASAWENEASAGLDTSQVSGKTSSYAKKYALQNLFAIDDTKDADVEHTDPEPKQNTGLKVTKKQLETLFGLAKQQGFTDQELALNWLTEQEDKDPREMTVKEASDLISKLMDK